MKMKPTILAMMLLGIVACKKDNEAKPIVSNNKLIGYWLNPVYADSTVTYGRVSELKDKSYGIVFKADGTCVERKINGWCGTPPVTYSDYNGTWTMADSVISIKVGYWGGVASYTWKLKSVTNDSLKIVIKEQKFPYPMVD